MIHILDENQIAENYERFRKLINQTFEGERLEKLNKMYDQLEDRIILTPASSFEHFHNAFAGGYVDHVLRVTLNAVKTYEFQQDLGIDMSSLTKETVIFTALHHDLGKVGKCTEEEWISIKLTDGLYDDSNAEYLRKAFADQKLKTPLPHLMHQADLNACTFESQRLIKLKQGEVTTKNLGGRPTKKAKLENVKMPDKIDFKSIFGETEDV